MPVTYFLNVNFICNERCVFCAAELASGPLVVPDRKLGVTLQDVRAWTASHRPGALDEVAIAGGEPTLHPELLTIIRDLATNGPSVTLFTNGLKLADEAYAREVLAAGVTRVAIALFGEGARTHEAVTRRRGSFERTLAALTVLGGLHGDFDFVLELRLLVAQQCFRENPAIVELIARTVSGIDAVSLNRLILSGDAAAAGAPVSWDEAHASINETARLIRVYGYDLGFEALPLCVYDGDNAEYIRARIAERVARGLHARAAATLHYLDPVTAAADSSAGVISTPRALPRVCRICDLLLTCGRVEDWYVERFGTAGLHPVRLGRRTHPRISQ